MNRAHVWNVYVYHNGDTPLFDVLGLPFRTVLRCMAYDSGTEKYYLVYSPKGEKKFQEINMFIGKNGAMQHIEPKKVNLRLSGCSLEYIINEDHEKICFPERCDITNPVSDTLLTKRIFWKRDLVTQWVNWEGE